MNSGSTPYELAAIQAVDPDGPRKMAKLLRVLAPQLLNDELTPVVGGLNLRYREVDIVLAAAHSNGLPDQPSFEAHVTSSGRSLICLYDSPCGMSAAAAVTSHQGFRFMTDLLPWCPPSSEMGLFFLGRPIAEMSEFVCTVNLRPDRPAFCPDLKPKYPEDIPTGLKMAATRIADWRRLIMVGGNA